MATQFHTYSPQKYHPGSSFLSHLSLTRLMRNHGKLLYLHPSHIDGEKLPHPSHDSGHPSFLHSMTGHPFHTLILWGNFYGDQVNFHSRYTSEVCWRKKSPSLCSALSVTFLAVVQIDGRPLISLVLCILFLSFMQNPKDALFSTQSL